jgi:hypothetical protein
MQAPKLVLRTVQKNAGLQGKLMAMSFHGAKRIGNLITPLTLRELGMPPDIARLPEIAAAWGDAAGPDLSAHVHPIRYTDGRLVLRASSPVWVSKVRHSHETLTRALRAHPLFKELIGLEVRAAPLDLGRRRQSTQRARALSPGTRKLLESVAGDIADPELRAALTRLGRKVPR